VSDILEDIKTLSEKRDSIESKTSKEYKDLSEEIVALTKKRNIKINSL
jgi:histidinol phosphatase-like PHP family hydrolase